MKFILSILFITSCAFCSELNLLKPVEEFTIDAGYFHDDRTYIFSDSEHNKEIVGHLAYAKVEDLTSYILTDNENNIAGFIEEQFHEAESLFTYDRIFLLKNGDGDPIGTMTVHSSWGFKNYESFSLDGVPLFSGHMLAYNLNDDIYQKNYISTNLLGFFALDRTTTIRIKEIFEDNPELWLHYILIKGLLWNVNRNY